MRLQIVNSKNAASLYIVKSTYDKNGARSNKVVEKLGTMNELKKLHDDPVAWGRQYAKELTLKEKEQKKRITVEYNPSSQIEKDKACCFNGGYLFLQKIYYELGLDQICRDISKKYNFEYDLNSILSRLVYGRILFPGSKLSTHEECKSLLEPCSFSLQDIYRSLEVLNRENEFIQSSLFRNSEKVIDRNTGILFYDCTNFFFETESSEEGTLRQYGYSKDHKPNPIVEMGLFLDGDGIPLAFSIHPGNTNEQTTLKPLEEMILNKYGRNRFIVCTDAGLSSNANRRFNSVYGRAFITAQSLRVMKEYLREWALSDDGWKFTSSGKTYTLQEILSEREANYDKIFFKERWVNDDGIEQRFIVSFSIRYQDYLRTIREKHIQRAEKYIEKGFSKSKKTNDPKRYISEYFLTDSGEVADKKILGLNDDIINADSMYDGFYCVATSLEDDAETIIRINKNRWEIEDSFRTMKTEFKARPVYLSRDDRIQAHFLTCFIALYIFRILRKRLSENFSTHSIISTLRKMLFLEVPREGYIPAYTRTDITDALHDAFSFHTDYEILTLSELRKISKMTKKH